MALPLVDNNAGSAYSCYQIASCVEGKMPQRDWFILMGMGALLILLGIGAIFWGKSEEKSYYSTIAHRPDVREYLEHLPWRPEPTALKIGGRIAIVLGALMLLAGIALLIWG